MELDRDDGTGGNSHEAMGSVMHYCEVCGIELGPCDDPHCDHIDYCEDCEEEL